MGEDVHQYPTALEWEHPARRAGSNCTVIKPSRALAPQCSYAFPLQQTLGISQTWWSQHDCIPSWRLGDLCRTPAQSPEGRSSKLFPASAPSNTHHVYACALRGGCRKPRAPPAWKITLSAAIRLPPGMPSAPRAAPTRAPACSRSAGAPKPGLAPRPGPGSGRRVEGPVGSWCAPGRWEPNLPLILPCLNPKSRPGTDPTAGALRIDTGWSGQGLAWEKRVGKVLRGGREVSPGDASLQFPASQSEEEIVRESSSRERDGEVLPGRTGLWKC